MIYTPVLGFSGYDDFTFEICDKQRDDENPPCLSRDLDLRSYPWRLIVLREFQTLTLIPLVTRNL